MSQRAKMDLKNYLRSIAWCTFHKKKKFQAFWKSCSRMSQKAKIDWKILYYTPLDVVLTPSIKINPFLSHVPEFLKSKHGLENDVVFPAWCNFYTKQKFQPFFKSFSTLSEKAKMDLKITYFPPLDVSFIPSTNFHPFFSLVVECLRERKWT